MKIFAVTWCCLRIIWPNHIALYWRRSTFYITLWQFGRTNRKPRLRHNLLTSIHIPTSRGAALPVLNRVPYIWQGKWWDQNIAVISRGLGRPVEALFMVRGMTSLPLLKHASFLWFQDDWSSILLGMSYKQVFLLFGVS